MHTLPLHISLVGKNVLIVGGGFVALRKIKSLLATGAEIRVVAASILHELHLLASVSGFTIEERHYSEADIQNAFLVIAATNAPDVNSQIARYCKERKILVTVVDNPSAGDCIFPALLRRGELTVSVSTAGKCPGYAAFVRDTIAGTIDDRYGVIIPQLAAEREKQLTDGNRNPYNSKVLRAHITSILDRIKRIEEA